MPPKAKAKKTVELKSGGKSEGKTPADYWDTISRGFRSQVRENGLDEDNPISRWIQNNTTKEQEYAEAMKKLLEEQSAESAGSSGPMNAKEKSELKKQAKFRAAALAKEKKRRKLGDQMVIAERIDSVLVHALCQSVLSSSYQGLTALCFWNADLGDKGLSHLCAAIPDLPAVKKLEVLDCMITKVGCVSLGACLSKESTKLKILRVDHNAFGSSGLQALLEGLSMNSSLTIFSAQYCGVQADAGPALGGCLKRDNIILKSLNLCGNNLGAPGIANMALGMKDNKTLTDLNIALNQFGKEPRVIQALAQAFRACTQLSRINMDGNLIGNEGVRQLFEQLHDCRHITELVITPLVDPVGFRMLKEWTQANGGGGPSKGKKVLKKKKKKSSTKKE